MADIAPTLAERQSWYTKSPVKVDASHRKRVVPLQVLNLGMMRTGTMSIKQALDILGIPCYHGAVLLTRPSDVPFWTEALDAKFFNKGRRYGRDDWDKLVGEFGALSDVPAIAFAEDLIEAYPEAKVILTERSLEEWKPSFDEAVVQACWNPKTHAIASLDRWWLGPLRDMTMKWVRGWYESNSKEEMLARAASKYREHYALVRKHTPADRLLEYELGSGWEPLCAFLGKPVPDMPFPTSNDRKSLREMVGLISRRGVINLGKALALIAVPAVVAWVVLRAM